MKLARHVHNTQGTCDDNPCYRSSTTAMHLTPQQTPQPHSIVLILSQRTGVQSMDRLVRVRLVRVVLRARAHGRGQDSRCHLPRRHPTSTVHARGGVGASALPPAMLSVVYGLVAPPEPFTTTSHWTAAYEGGVMVCYSLLYVFYGREQ